MDSIFLMIRFFYRVPVSMIRFFFEYAALILNWLFDRRSILRERADLEQNEVPECNKKKISKFKNSRRPRNESPASKRARKRAVREAKAEKRMNKVKKHLKKRKRKGVNTVKGKFVSLSAYLRDEY